MLKKYFPNFHTFIKKLFQKNPGPHSLLIVFILLYISGGINSNFFEPLGLTFIAWIIIIFLLILAIALAIQAIKGGDAVNKICGILSILTILPLLLFLTAFYGFFHGIPPLALP